MVDEEQKSANQKTSWWYYYSFNKIRDLWNATLGKRYGLTTGITRSGELQAYEVLERYGKLIQQNDTMVKGVDAIEKKWELIEKFLFGSLEYVYEKEPKLGNVSEIYRNLEYFRDPDYAGLEAEKFKERGTIEVTQIPVPVDPVVLKRALEAEKEILEKKDKLNEEEESQLTRIIEVLSILENPDNFKKISTLPDIKPKGIKIPYMTGEIETIVAISDKRDDISTKYDLLRGYMNPFSAYMGADVPTRGAVDVLIDTVRDKLKQIRDIETEHAQRVERISKILEEIKTEIVEDTGIVGNNRPDPNFIRFAHTYKIIKPYRAIEKHSRSGVDYEVKSFKEEHEPFKRDDEQLGAGVDENNWPLELYKDSDGDWCVLTDKWWVEISENDWQKATILAKNGGPEIWRDKVENGVRKKIPGYTKRYRSGYVRVVPKDKGGVDKGGYVGDLEPVDKISFISNESDSFRDDYRDGRYHPHSKTCMDYIIAGTYGITPEDAIKFEINTLDEEIRIKFRPIYYTKVDTKDQSLLGTVNPNGGYNGISLNDIPQDEREVSRRYEMDYDIVIGDEIPISERKDYGSSDGRKGTLKNMVRKPTHLNPAFDRAALINEHKFIHWGRMLYYETTDGINRWSENPFPHVSTRGIAKYIIDLVIRKSFSFDEARNALKGHNWDYGIRHYGEPFTTDPLGPAEEEGGALWHGKVKAREHKS